MSHAEWGDLEGYFDDAVVFVEWPQAGSGFLPPEKVRVRLQHVGETRRLLVLESDEKSLEKSIFTGADPRV
jgi:tRNA A37 threonylcarbamoyladenosine biosynthesis protein TsaE